PLTRRRLGKPLGRAHRGRGRRGHAGVGRGRRLPGHLDRRRQRRPGFGQGHRRHPLPALGAAVRSAVGAAARRPRRRDRPVPQADPAPAEGCALMHLAYPAVLAALLFCVGLYGVLARRNASLVLAIVLLVYRNRGTSDVDKLTDLADTGTEPGTGSDSGSASLAPTTDNSADQALHARGQTA